MKRPLFAVCLVITCVIALYYWLYPPSLPDKVPAEAAEIIIYGRIDRKENRNSYGKEQFILYLSDVFIYDSMPMDLEKNQFLFGQNQSKELWKTSITNQILCYTASTDREPKMGSFVLVRGKPEDFHRATNPGGFDSRLYYATLGIDFAVKEGELLWESEEYSHFRETLWKLRTYWCRRLEQVLGETSASVMKTMLLGDKTSLDKDIKSLYQDGGISHILAISGMHISMIGMGLYRLLRKIGVPIWLSAVFGGFCILAYGMLTGAGVSGGRAVGMFLIRMLAEVLGRGYDTLTALGVLLLWMVCQQPLYLYHSGFLLSFSAIFAIGCLGPALEQGRKQKRRYREGMEKKLHLLKENTRKNFMTGAVVTLATLPITFWYFYEVPLYGVLLNLLVLPLIPAVMYLGMSVLLLPEGIWLRLFAVPLELLLYMIQWLCRGSLLIPGGNFIRGRPRVWQMALYVAILVGIVLGRKKLKRWCRFCLLGVALLILCLKWENGSELTFLDVGQGDCIVIQAERGRACLVDCGSSSEGDVGKYMVAPFLKYEGITYLEAVIITHPDEDHCNGLESLLKEGYGGRIGRLLLPAVAEGSGDEACRELAALAGNYGIPVGYLSAGMVWTAGEMQFSCLHPRNAETTEKGTYEVVNSDSIVLYVSRGGFSALLTGDVEETGEKQLTEVLKRNGIYAVTVLKVAHHGSRYSTREAFLAALDVRIAVISCGRDNRYGHPHEELLERLTEEGAVILTTPERGAVEIWTDGKKMRLKTFLPGD